MMVHAEQLHTPHNCPLCDSKLHRRKSPDGHFWGCSGFLDGCGLIVPDVLGVPDLESLTSPLSTVTASREFVQSAAPLRRAKIVEQLRIIEKS